MMGTKSSLHLSCATLRRGAIRGHFGRSLWNLCYDMKRPHWMFQRGMEAHALMIQVKIWLTTYVIISLNGLTLPCLFCFGAFWVWTCLLRFCLKKKRQPSLMTEQKTKGIFLLPPLTKLKWKSMLANDRNDISCHWRVTQIDSYY